MDLTSDNFPGFRYRSRRYVPEDVRISIIRENHDSPTLGYRGAAATLGLLSREY